MNQEDAFIEAILQHPDDDTPRLVYADWLEEHGQGERAEFIRVQCNLARLPDDDPRRATLQVREQKLLKEHEGEWTGPLLGLLSGMVTKWRFRRGFVDELAMEARGLR